MIVLEAAIAGAAVAASGGVVVRRHRKRGAVVAQVRQDFERCAGLRRRAECRELRRRAAESLTGAVGERGDGVSQNGVVRVRGR